MATTEPPFSGLVFPADDEAQQDRWLAVLLAALQTQIRSQDHADVAVALTDPSRDAQAASDAEGDEPAR